MADQRKPNRPRRPARGGAASRRASSDGESRQPGRSSGASRRAKPPEGTPRRGSSPGGPRGDKPPEGASRGGSRRSGSQRTGSGGSPPGGSRGSGSQRGGARRSGPSAAGRGRTGQPERPPERGGKRAPRPAGPGADPNQLPRWVRDDVQRVTPKERRLPALQQLAAGVEAFDAARYPAARARLEEARRLSPRAAIIRELLGLSAYRTGAWRDALGELRTYRRLTGDTTHMAVEMDCLRALDRPADVERVWEEFTERGADKDATAEAKVVFASFLLDRGEIRRAWDVIRPGRLIADPSDTDLRRWYVAARIAAAAGDRPTATKLLSAITKADPEFPGLDDLAILITG